MEIVNHSIKNKSYNGKIIIISLAHLINDIYGNFIYQLIPFLITGGLITVLTGSYLVSAFTISSSIAQPIFGILVDQKNQRWLIFVGTLWMSIFLGLTGYINNYLLLLIDSFIAGLGTAAFHPQASAMIGYMSGKRKGFILAFFIALGNIGAALSPIIFLNLFQQFGVKSTWIAIIPGIIVAILLFFFAPRLIIDKKKQIKWSEIIGILKDALTKLINLIAVVALRSLTNFGIILILPLYLLSHHYNHIETSFLMFLTLASGAIGGMIGGHFTDKYGRKTLIVSSLFLSSIIFTAFLYTSGIIMILFLALGGFVLLSSFSVTVAYAQEEMPDYKAMASGITLGFSIGIGGLFVSLLGKYADVYGYKDTLQLIFLIPIVAGLIALTLKEK